MKTTDIITKEQIERFNKACELLKDNHCEWYTETCYFNKGKYKELPPFMIIKSEIEFIRPNDSDLEKLIKAVENINYLTVDTEKKLLVIDRFIEEK